MDRNYDESHMNPDPPEDWEERPATIKLRRNCVCCGKEVAFYVSNEGFRNWQNGELIQEALPDLAADEQKMIISGICEICFNSICDDTESDGDVEVELGGIDFL